MRFSTRVTQGIYVFETKKFHVAVFHRELHGVTAFNETWPGKNGDL